MANRECGKGHIYDSNQYSACPYCNGETSVISFEGGSSESTVAPNMGVSDEIIGKTVSSITPNTTTADEGKTVAPGFEKMREEEDNKTIGVFRQNYNLDPIVGWLVCIDGPDKGKDYHLWAKINTIGRSEKMDVCIKNDKTITKENHARLAYDPKHNDFRLIPADSSNNIYVNEEPIYTPVKIKAYDIIELGNSKTVFVPFCNEHFNWEDGVKQES